MKKTEKLQKISKFSSIKFYYHLNNGIFVFNNSKVSSGYKIVNVENCQVVKSANVWHRTKARIQSEARAICNQLFLCFISTAKAIMEFMLLLL
uniref:Uncharacterized protein n=1 Tax=Romanomermis culicivorax TaxID=13658 RepID=A0A915I9D0_ROMCU